MIFFMTTWEQEKKEPQIPRLQNLSRFFDIIYRVNKLSYLTNEKSIKCNLQKFFGPIVNVYAKKFLNTIVQYEQKQQGYYTL